MRQATHFHRLYIWACGFIIQIILKKEYADGTLYMFLAPSLLIFYLYIEAEFRQAGAFRQQLASFPLFHLY